MKLSIFLITVISTAWAQTKNVERSVRNPQGQIKYDEIDGSRVNLKYITPGNQWQLANAQRPQRAEGGSSHHLRQTQQTTAPQYRAPAPQPQSQKAQQQVKTPQYYSYKPYSAVPGHIRQLIDSVYQPQVPYVDPSSFLYGGGYAPPQQPAPSASEIPQAAYQQPSARYQSIDPQRYNDRTERQDRVAYKEDYEQQQQEQQQQQQQQQQVATSPFGTLPEPPTPILYLDKNMPTEIKQLLQYQAQIPYDVTANRIQYTPKNIFIPKPLSDDAKGPHYYRSKVYYPSDENVDAEYSQDQPIDEGQSH
ncbi:adenylate cyclase, terminal-differentiation specific [Camponotus floridanus]|uniref:adenylate cyclase, terminal-differentiation specific n=1 Tax=Camponotus floridanus TaxID=104421 RepID=UPI00059DFEB5|nr:adenylate cyclase, terminal-differentiation specific [Camponotus floridanus]